MHLYAEGHPARERTATVSHERLINLVETSAKPAFSFLDSEVIFGASTIRDLKGWEWGIKLASIGMERLEFLGRVPRDEWDAFLAEVFWRLTSGTLDPLQLQAVVFPTIKFGTIGVKGDGGAPGNDLTSEQMERPSISMGEELDTVHWIHEEVGSGRKLPVAEAEAVVASLALVMHSDSEILLPLLQLKEYDQYIATHSLNVSVLAMALAEFRGLAPRDVRAMGVAGLMHDLGMVRVPHEILQKPEPPTEKEWELIREHPKHGAQIILASEPQVDIAAVVAYEHHVLQNGTGYPRLHFARECHYATKLIQICDRYDSLRTRRPFRDMWSPERSLQYVEERAGTEFEPEMAKAFAMMIRQWDGRIVPVDDQTPVRAAMVAGRMGELTKAGRDAEPMLPPTGSDPLSHY